MLLAFGLLSLVSWEHRVSCDSEFEFQMLDELPMLYLVTLMAYLVLEPGPTRRFGRWFPWTLGGYAVLATMSATLTRGQLQFFAFQITFGALELYCLVRVYLLSLEPGNGRIRAVFKVGVALYVAAIGLWSVDVRFCPTMTRGWPAVGLVNPQLHAWWHVLVSCGFYMLLLVVGYDRLRRAGAHEDSGGRTRRSHSRARGVRAFANQACARSPGPGAALTGVRGLTIFDNLDA